MPLHSRALTRWSPWAAGNAQCGVEGTSSASNRSAAPYIVIMPVIATAGTRIRRTPVLASGLQTGQKGHDVVPELIWGAAVFSPSVLGAGFG
jgi:hypothetical protein